MNRAVENPRALVLMGLVLVACGGVSQEDYRESYGEALCHRQARCGEIRDEDACVREARGFASAYREAGLIVYAQYEGSIRAGRLRFNEEAAQECVQHVRDLSCNEPLPPARSGVICDVLEGQQKDGEPCLITEECGEASYCERTDGPVCETGTCKARLGLGQRVSNFQECAPGLVLVGATCQAPLGEGEACVGDSVCASGLYCAGGNLWCRRFALEGESCGTERCLPHLACSEGSCQRRFDVGMDCTVPQSNPGGASECKRDLFCADGGGARPGTCSERLGPGERCFGDTCKGNLFCDWLGGAQEGSCQAFRQLGESCTSVPCVPGAYCDEGSRTCLRQGRLGEPCGSPYYLSCISGLWCENGTCESGFGGFCEQPRG
jgi:hypothetical protein